MTSYGYLLCELTQTHNRHVIQTSIAKRPGEINNNSAENIAFNAGRGYRYAYEVAELYRLETPITYYQFRTECRGKAPICWQFAKIQLILRAAIEDMIRVW